ncbi:MAG: MFS transporter [Syntrophorhabdaceae bacterium]|nr:MFS transporter [Syntrophorhabdaceae bacterium]
MLSALLSFSMFYRVSNAVITPYLIRDLSLNTKTLGILGGAFFYSFALMQIPMGLLLDRIGPRTVLTIFSLIGAIGAFVFSMAGSFFTATLGRILIGIGMASVLMGSMKVFVICYPPEKFATMSGTLISVGMLGTILASSPLAYLATTIGWRWSFAYAGVITGVLSFITLFLLKDIKVDNDSALLDKERQKGIPLKQVIKTILGDLSFWQIGLSAFFRYGTFVSLQGLWFGPYLIEVMGFSPIEAGNILMMLSIGFIAGSTVAGFISDKVFKSPKKTFISGVSFYSLSLIFLIFYPRDRDFTVFTLVFFAIGFFNSFGMLSFSHVKLLFPVEISATAIAGVNFFSMAGAAILMPLLGKIIEASMASTSGNPGGPYYMAFLTCAFGMVITLIFYIFSKEKKAHIDYKK